VLAVGIDSAEPTLIRELIERGELPTLASLLERGRWALVDSRADIGSGAVWPTFMSGSDPAEHQMYSGWVWQPSAMGCGGPHEPIRPFWRDLIESGGAVGVMDIPFAPFEGLARFEVSEWGAHDVLFGELRASPPRAEEIVARGEQHPFYEVPHGPGYLDDLRGKQRVSSACVAGARLRGELAGRLVSETHPDLSIVVFTEVHHATHQLWHTVAPDDPIYAGKPDLEDVKPNLVDLYREIDRQIGRIVEAAGSETAVMAFSLHGMKAGPGIPMVHEHLLEVLGFAAPGPWRGLSWRDRAAALLGATKRRAPASLRALYHRAVSYRARRRLARPTAIPPHDWSRTRAFCLPTDQHGYIRINLAGREAKGIVPERDYGATCDRLEDALRTLKSADGEPLVEGVLRPAEEGGSPPEHLPDLVVDWDDAAFACPVRAVSGSIEFESLPIRNDMTGQHARHGFCILDDRLADQSIDELVAGKDLHKLLLSALGAVRDGVPR
jgi:predicted AlkP superfamily phosphohydrolase/phosphomutase